MIIDAYNTTQNVRGRSDYLTGARPGQPAPPYVPFDPRRILDRMDAAGVDMAMVCSLAQRIENDFIISLVKAHPQRLFGFDPGLTTLPSVRSLSLRLGVKFSSVDVSLFANNLTDETDSLSRSHDSVGSPLYYAESYAPRTIGLTGTFRY